MLDADSFIFLLGAGASYDAGIPISSKMITLIESLIIEDEKWKKYRDLYYCVKSGIVNAAGMTGNFSPNIVNVETLVNTMEELLKSYEHPLYPFIGSWIPRLMNVCDNNFDRIREFKALILDKLCNKWTKCKYPEDYSYYKKFAELQQEYNFPLSIFSLNYDLCLERSVGNEYIQRGFGVNHSWKWENLDEDSNIREPIRLYKLHGSIDWEKTDTGDVIESEKVSYEDAAIIFGTSYKLQYIDPFLYLVNVFRKKTLLPNTKGIICIGYSFGDEHINGIISQALNNRNDKKIISVAPIEDESKERERIEKIMGKDIGSNLILVNKKAKNWLISVSCNEIESYIGGQNLVPF